MANRVEITENVESAIGLNITGASVTVKFRGGAQAPVYDAENGGTLLSQPLATVNGKIGADSPSGAWVAAGEYDLVVAFGGDTLTFAWDADVPFPLVTTLPAGVGTSAPEDGETTIELYDSANGGAWLRRWRAAVTAWDMIGGPPPSGAVLPGAPRARQEFYVTGGSPAVQHQRYNGTSWEYVGTPPMVPVTGSPLTVLDVGQPNQIRAGRQLVLADFTTLLAAPTAPVGLFNLSNLTNLGTGGNLINKGAVNFDVGIEGVASAAAIFTGNTARVLYIADTGAADPFRLRVGSVGSWVRTARLTTVQRYLTKYDSAGTGYALRIATSGVAVADIFIGGVAVAAAGTTLVADARWHHVAFTYDGSLLVLYVDGKVDAVTPTSGLIDVSAKAFNIGGWGGDGATVSTEPHYGSVDEAFVTGDILSEDQIRLLYAAKIIHGYSTLPRLAALGVRRRKRGAPLVSADFPSQPLRLYTHVAGVLTDQGSNNTVLTNTGAAVAVAGADGTKDGAFNYVTASAQSLNSTDTGLPAGVTSRSYGIWVKTATPGAGAGIMGWGTITTNDARIAMSAAGLAFTNSGANSLQGPFIADGRWHHLVVTEENAPLDGVRRRFYVDGRMMAAEQAALTSITLAGAAKFRIGAAPDGTSPFTGQLTGAFVHAAVLTPEQVASLYQKSSQELSQSIKDPSMHEETMDATNVYVILDNVDTNSRLDLSVAG